MDSAEEVMWESALALGLRSPTKQRYISPALCCSQPKPLLQGDLLLLPGSPCAEGNGPLSLAALL